MQIKLFTLSVLGDAATGGNPSPNHQNYALARGAAISPSPSLQVLNPLYRAAPDRRYSWPGRRSKYTHDPRTVLDSPGSRPAILAVATLVARDLQETNRATYARVCIGGSIKGKYKQWALSWRRCQR